MTKQDKHQAADGSKQNPMREQEEETSRGTKLQKKSNLMCISPDYK